MHDDLSDVEFAIDLALKCGSIHAYEERAMRSLIATNGLLAFEQLLTARERGALSDDEEIVYQRLGVTREWVAERLK